MDYETKPTSRNNLRNFAKECRKLFDVPLTGPFPVLEALEKLPDVLPNCNYVVLEDDEFPSKVMARCHFNEFNGMTIEIRNSVYTAAYENGVGMCLDFICHEICHVFLFFIGFVPFFDRAFKNSELPAYKSIEWQAKALCGELMIPYDDSIGLTKKEIISRYHVSEASAKVRIGLDKKSTAM